ncbi:MAG TPA: antibiotic biosynthesis monooxygenase [Trebonia sp.]|nr:antibiotic biosynthesis monooxygenase [Trebonia sp.]
MTDSMAADETPYALVVRFTVRPGSEAEFDELITRVAAGVRELEPETLVFACHHVEGASLQRVFYELYRDKAAFDAHSQQPHVRDFTAARAPLLESTVVDYMTLTDGKAPVADPTS